MSNIDTSIHHVTRLNIEVVARNSSNYTTLYVFCADGTDFEITLHGEHGQPIALTLGDPNE